MKVKEFMIKDVISVHEEALIVDTLKLFVKSRIGGAPVVDENNKLVTMLSDGDIMRFLKPQDRTIYDMLTLVMISKKQDFKEQIQSSMQMPVKSIFRKKRLYTLKPDDNLEKAITVLGNHRIKKLPVLNEKDQVIGVISRGDVIRYVASKLINEEDKNINK